jgi:hypothetical protein
MRTWLGFLTTLVCCCTVTADDAVEVLSKHLGRTPALVVVVCRGDERDVPTITALVEQTPWTVLCRSPPVVAGAFAGRWPDGTRVCPGASVCGRGRRHGPGP